MENVQRTLRKLALEGEAKQEHQDPELKREKVLGLPEVGQRLVIRPDYELVTSSLQ